MPEIYSGDKFEVVALLNQIHTCIWLGWQR